MQYIQSLDLLQAVMVWGPAVFALFTGAGLLLAESRYVRALAFVIPAVWVLADLVAAVVTMESGRLDHPLLKAALYQVLGIVVATAVLGVILGVLATLAPRIKLPRSPS